MTNPRSSNGKYRKLPPRTSSPVVRELLEIVDASGRPYKEVANDAGVYDHALTNWRHGKATPRVELFESIAASLGYRLVLEKIDATEE